MRFRNFNSNFGRKYIRLNKDIFGKKHTKVEFDLKHINFYKTEVNNNKLSDLYNTGTQSNIYEEYPRNMIFIRAFETRGLYYFQPSDRIPSPSLESDNDNDVLTIENELSEYDSNIEEEKEDDLSIS
jgi:hypothetical protein